MSQRLKCSWRSLQICLNFWLCWLKSRGSKSPMSKLRSTWFLLLSKFFISYTLHITISRMEEVSRHVKSAKRQNFKKSECSLKMQFRIVWSLWFTWLVAYKRELESRFKQSLMKNTLMLTLMILYSWIWRCIRPIILIIISAFSSLLIMLWKTW